MINSTKGMPKVVSEKLCVVYDAKGKVVHMHKVSTMEGAVTPSDDLIKARALEHAEKMKNVGISATKLKAVLVEPKSFHPGSSHTIDLKTLTLVAKPIAAPGGEKPRIM
jgi:hypothetical protein